MQGLIENEITMKKNYCDSRTGFCLLRGKQVSINQTPKLTANS